MLKHKKYIFGKKVSRPNILIKLVIGLALVAILTPWHLTTSTREITVKPPVKNGGYPELWANAPPSTLQDSWGYPNRICSSYVAYRAYKEFGIHIGGWTDLKDWELQAIHRGFTVDEIPSTNSIAITSTFEPGHVAWVEGPKNDGSGEWRISQYNANGGGGHYSEGTIYPRFVKFIHLDKKIN